MQKTEHILTVAVFGHGCENLLGPFSESDPIGSFYKNAVRVFSQACVPDIPSVTAAHDHNRIARELRKHMQTEPETLDTFSILEPYMSECKSTYVKMFKNESMKTMHPEFDERLFDPQYNTRSCGTTTYLANKTFHFYEERPDERSLNFHGVVLLDVRLKKTFEDGHVEYERVFDPPSRNTDPIVLTTRDGLLFLLKNILRKKPKECDSYLKLMGISGKKTNLTEIDLIKLFDILNIFNFVNILDYTCRMCRMDSRTLSRRKLSHTQIEDLYAKEQHYASLLPKFGGIRKSKTKRKTRKNIKKLK